VIDYNALCLAIRARLEAMQVCTTGSQSLAATATGYTRTSGNFIADGFTIGMEVTPSGFVDNTPGVITGITALALTILGGRTVAAAAGGRTLVNGYPLLRAYENTAFQPVQSRPYVEEEFLTETPPMLRGMFDQGVMESLPTYVVRWYGLANTSRDALDKGVQQLLRMVPAGYTFALADGTRVKVRGDLMPSRSRPLPDKPGWNVITVTIPLRAYTQNPVPA
jgi:hypothetical protein